MFYSHELLTNRQYGVATIWLVATLGSKSSLKKVTRKAILDVDVPKACDKITDPAAPLALRLQGSLLYGVSRVYSQQCQYVLADTHSFRDKMRGIAQIMKELEIDPDVGKMRPDQLNLPEDPGFIPNLDMNFDLAIFDIPSDSGTSRASSVFFARQSVSSQSCIGPAAEDEQPQLELPSVDSPDGFEGFDFNLGSGVSSALKTGSRAGAADILQESAIIEDPGFTIGEEGIILGPPNDHTVGSEVPVAVVGEGRAISESGMSARVQAELEAGLVEDQPLLGSDQGEGFTFGEEEGPPLLPAKAFPPVDPRDEAPAQAQPESSMRPSYESTTTTTAEAPQRRTRQPRQLPVDERAELSNRQLGEWSTNYLTNMDAISRSREQNKSLVQAKKNAAFWILGQGVGGVELNFGEDHFPHPLSMFSGQDLLDALTGGESSPAGSKRARSQSLSFGEEEEGRRVRPREDNEQEVGRDDEGPILGFDDDGMFPQDDPREIESEVGRYAPSSLRDQSSAMPWNLSSRAGSLQLVASAGLGRSLSLVGTGSLPFGPPSALSGRRSRMTSASPLIAKAQRLPSLAIEENFGSGGDEGMLLGDDGMDQAGAIDIDDFELYGPSATVDTQTAAQSQWLKTTLENEAYNFLTFVETQIGERGTEIRDEEGTLVKSITLDDLLPPTQNTKVVGAQAMLHVLALTTKGLMDVEQEEAFGDIRMRVVRGYVKDDSAEHDDEGQMQME